MNYECKNFEIRYFPGKRRLECAKRLNDYFLKVSGTDIPIVRKLKKYKSTAVRIITGCQDDFIGQHQLKCLHRKKLSEPDSFRIIISGRQVFLIGMDIRGLFYAVNQFLEDYLNIRWLTPWDTHIPKIKTISLPEQYDKVYTPSYKNRGFHICASGYDNKGEPRFHYDEKILEWMAANKLNVKFTHNHEIKGVGKDLERLFISPLGMGNCYDHFIPKKLFRTHPDFFPLIEGHRVGTGVIKRCLCSREFQKYFIAQIKVFSDKYPTVKHISIHPSDGLGACQCAGCKAMDTLKDRKNGTISGRIWKFSSIIAKELAKLKPEITLTLCSYSLWADPPSDFKKQKNIEIGVTFFGNRCYSHAINDPACPSNATLLKTYQKVKPVSEHLMVYDYFNLSRNIIGYIPSVMAKNIDFFHQNKANAYWGEITADRELWDMVMVTMYVFAQKTWATEKDYREIVKDFCKYYFKSASQNMIEYYNFVEELIIKNSNEHLIHSPDILNFTDEKAFELAGKLLEAALENIENNNGQKKILRERVITQATLLERVKKAKANIGKIEPIETISAGKIQAPSLSPDSFSASSKVYLVDNTSFDMRGYVKIAYDNKNIFLMFSCPKPGIKTEEGKIRESKNADNKISMSSHVDFFLSPVPSSGYYYQFMIDMENKVFFQKCKALQWDGSFKPEIETEIISNKDDWRLHVKIAIETIGGKTIRKNGNWKAGFNYVQVTVGTRHVSSWPYLQGNGAFHKLEKFGNILFS